jgi:hypothetical protein
LNAWYVIFLGIVILGTIIIIPLGRRWYTGCGLALLGGALGASAAFGAGWWYLRYAYVAPKRDINDWSGLVVVAFWLVGFPIAGMGLGSILGIWSAYLVSESIQDKSRKP